MPLKGIPNSITPELLYALAKMGHGDYLVIADSNFPSDSIADSTICKHPIRIYNGNTTVQLLEDIMKLISIDTYSDKPISVMDRVASDKLKNLHVSTYDQLDQIISSKSELSSIHVDYIERFEFYEVAKKAYCIIQTNDSSPYANIIVHKGVL